MQIASQVFKLKTAENALIFFSDDEPAYITKRFDLNEDGSKKYQEDFTSLGGRTEEIDGKSFKYEGNYQGIAENIIRYIPAHIRELERFFQLVVFNYLFSNGDAHLKNFSILESEDGDPLLSPAYDLISTRIHVKDSDMALKNGLFSDQFTTESYLSNAFYAHDDFMEFGKRIGIKEKRINKLYDPFIRIENPVYDLISKSFLDDGTKDEYRELYTNKLQALRYSFRGQSA